MLGFDIDSLRGLSGNVKKAKKTSGDISRNRRINREYNLWKPFLPSICLTWQIEDGFILCMAQRNSINP